MRKLPLFVCSLGIVLLSSLAFAENYTIKSYYYGRSAFNFSTDGWLKTSLLSESNFGGSTAVVKDVKFTSITLSNSFDYQTYSDADIFVAIFGEDASTSLTQTQANGLRDFVLNGGSLIVVADYDPRSIQSANLVGALFGGVTFQSGSSAATTNFLDIPAFSDITDGPFGKVNSVSWGSNIASTISQSGDSTILDTRAIVSVIAPTETRGSVFFFHDPYNFFGTYAYGDHHNLLLNMFNYSAESVGGTGTSNTVPEPCTVMLMSLSVIGFGLKRIRTNLK